MLKVQETLARIAQIASRWVSMQKVQELPQLRELQDPSFMFMDWENNEYAKSARKTARIAQISRH